jgi:hypothetical protein
MDKNEEEYKEQTNETIIQPSIPTITTPNLQSNPDEIHHNNDDINVLSGDNKIDVGIKPDVKSNDVYLQLCSCSLVFNCFTTNSTAKNSD